MKKASEIFIIAVFMLLIIAAPVASYLSPRLDYSEFENRQLTVFPSITKESVLNGSAMSQFADFYADHFILRDAMLTAYVGWNLNFLHRPVVNEVTVQGDTLLPFLGYTKYNYENIAKNCSDMTEQIAGLAETVERYGGKFCFVGIPGQYSMLRDQYPEYMDNKEGFYNFVEERFFSELAEQNVDAIDMRQTFLALPEVERYYSKVDHHYNFDGAYVTYREIMDYVSQYYAVDVLKEEDLVYETVDKPFYGSRNRKLYNMFQTDEKLRYALPKDRIEFIRSDNGQTVESSVVELPDTAYATYSVYMGGDKGETVISTNREELPDILIFGDSFTNPVETLLYYSFDEMRSVDLRYYTEKSIAEYVQEYQPDVVLYMRDDSVYITWEGNGILK